MENPELIKIQNQLLALGFNPGVIDGVWGRNSIAALKAFQKAKGLKEDGILGPRSLAALLPDNTTAPASPLIPWYSEALNLVGTKEVLGDRNNPTILDWADNLDIHYPGDEVPWCGLFVAHCTAVTLPEEALPSNPLGARNWKQFGQSTEPRLGAIMVFWRESRSSYKGHVGFYAGESADSYNILGGNQSDSVCYTWLAKSRLLEARWPTSAASIQTTRVDKSRTGGLSEQEA